MSGLPAKILLVENSKLFQQMVGEALHERLGVPVVHAHSLAEAAQLIEREGPFMLALTGLVLADGDQDSIVDFFLSRRIPTVIVTGVCETDFSGYPDCRDDTIKALQVAINLGTDAPFVIHTPLMWLDKAQTWALAQELGGDELVSVIQRETHTCYLGDRTQSHVWGYGCGECPACMLRSQGWARFQDNAEIVAKKIALPA